MKETKKRTFKLLLFLCVLFSTFYSCQDEDYIIENSIENKTFLTHKNKEFIFQNKDILNKLKSIENKRKSNYLGKSTKENFKIFYDKTTYYFSAEKNEETYSFLIERKKLGEKYLENLILRRKINEANFKSYIITYFLSNGANSKKEDCKVVSFEEIEIDTKILSRCEGNDYVIIETEHKCYSGQDSGVSEQGNCDYEKVGEEGPSSTWTVLVLPCQDEGGGSGSGPGSNNGTTWGIGITGNSYSEVYRLNDLLDNSLNEDQLNWVKRNSERVPYFHSVIKNNGESVKAKKWTEQAISFEVLFEKQLQIKQTGEVPSEISGCCPGSCCPDPFIYENDLIIKEYGVAPVQAAVDGFFNLFSDVAGLIGTEYWFGGRVRKLMIEIGMTVPTDIANEHLAAIFKIRKRNGVVILEYREGILKEMLDLGLNSLDMIAFLSPSKGGGAFLAIKTNGVTIAGIQKLFEFVSETISSSNRIVNGNTTRGVQALSKKISRGDLAYQGLKSTQEQAQKIIQEVMLSKNRLDKLTRNQQGVEVLDIFDTQTKRGIRLIKSTNAFDTFINYN
ncbi:hypothetical protein [uncultured Tenacibaculum sp.]|uniref:hypothetical protein n=1 Tax=uncultured Tenacibaculum sp. TaxID=174713 RepID=UPI0026280488|nr:hypothetical protein [uncultured Tenacibaculum sp.]